MLANLEPKVNPSNQSQCIVDLFKKPLLIRFSHRPRHGSQQLWRQEERRQSSIAPQGSREPQPAAASARTPRNGKMPKRKVSSGRRGSEGGAQEEIGEVAARLSTKPAPAKVETKPKKAAGKDKSSNKNVQAKGKRGPKGKQAEVTNQEPKEDLPTENRETKKEESTASDEREEKEAKPD
ncbi:Non-histone chromosomal protein HMG-14 [Heterocephalus glaber]|uniref:Non-histone chromosomal protein HMG-14 n=1 Tax=Heterocephalus glaber TaxID=10181 RepID=G5C7E7_HETGA|nr:Non-histone chromosomal protein HMG-14 [Heterocephalus glaber]